MLILVCIVWYLQLWWSKLTCKSQKYHNHSLWLQEDQTRLCDQDLQFLLSGQSHQEHHDHQVHPTIVQNIWVQGKYMGWLDE